MSTETEDYEPQAFPEARYLWDVFQFKLTLADVQSDPIIALLYHMAEDRVREVTRIRRALARTKAACDEALHMLEDRNQLSETRFAAYDVVDMITGLKAHDDRIGALAKAITKSRRTIGEMTPAERKAVAHRAAQKLAGSLSGQGQELPE